MGQLSRIFWRASETRHFLLAKAQTGGTTLRHAPGFAYAVQKDAYADLTFGNDVTWKANSSHDVHPGRLTWNLQITHLERKMIFQTSMIMFHVNLPGCT